MESFLPMGGFQLPFQRRLSRLYNDTKKSSDFVKDAVQNENNPEIRALHRKLRIQKDRLVSWGLEWSDPNQSAEIDESLSNAGLSEVVGSIMSTIKDILAEAEPLWQSSKHMIDSNRPSGDKKLPIVQWDKNRFEDLVRDLTSSIDTLYDLSRTRSGGIPRRTSKSIVKGSSSEDYKPFESSRMQTPQQIDPRTLTHIRPMHSPSEPGRQVVLMSKIAYSELMQRSSTRQPWAPLLLEYANFDPIYSTTGIMPDMARFEKLSAALQQDPQRSPDTWTGLPRLLGYFEDMENSRLGLVYRFPNSFNTMSFEKPKQNPMYNLPSLRDLLTQPDSEPTMEAKFRLAHNLANTIFDLHARGITHGKLCAGNVSFCASVTSQPGVLNGQTDTRRPLLSSFDLFPEDMGSMPANLTRHRLDPRCASSSPLPRTTDERVLELYSLSMVLLSIGLWSSLDQLIPGGDPASVFDSLLKRLSVRCGTLYTKAVQACFSAVEDELSGRVRGEDLLSEVQVKASRYLEACCILDGVSGLEERLGQELQQANATRKPSVSPVAPVAPAVPPKDVKTPLAKAAEVKAPPPPPKVPIPMGTERHDPLDMERQGKHRHQWSFPHYTNAGAEVQPSAVAKAEGKMKLYPHVPLPPDVIEKWNTILMPQINQALRGFYRKHPESVEISIESIGPNPQSTQPTVLVVCTSVGKVRAILKKRLGDLFEGSSGFGLKVCRGHVLRSRRHSMGVVRSMTRRSQAGGKESADEDDANAVNAKYQERPVNGASIGAWIGDRHLPPVSFGGLVMVDNKPYGMTVHHMLDDPDRDFPPGDVSRSMADPSLEQWYEESAVDSMTEDDFGFELSDSESEMYSDTDITSEYEDDDEDDEEFNQPGDIPGIEPGCGDGYVVTQPALDDVEEGFFPSADTEDEDHLDTFSLGEVYASSGIRRKNANGLVHEVDWALFQFSDSRLPNENVLPRAGDSALSKALSNPPLRPTAVATSASLPGTEVQCVARTSGLQTGKILPALTSVKIYGRTSPSHTYQITSTQSDGASGSTLPEFPMGIPGDSGAWIVDRHQGNLCGHVLAWSQRKHVAYICPMDILLQDIAETLEASEVGLPGGTPIAQAIKLSKSVEESSDPSDELARELEKLSQDLAEAELKSATPELGTLETPQEVAFAQTHRSISSQSMSSRGSPRSPHLDSPIGPSSLDNLRLASGRGIGVGG